MAEGDLWGRLSKHDDAFVSLLEQDSPIGIGDRVRFDHAKQMWHVWKPTPKAGAIWAPDKTGLVLDLVRDRYNTWAREMSERGDQEGAKTITAILDLNKKANVLKSLATRPKIAMAGDEWDPDPTLLAFTNGCLNLTTGEFDTDPSPDLLLSRSTRQKYDPTATAPRFTKFLSEVMGEQPELVTYLAGVLGYALFGWQREQKFWMWVGQGQNGKGTLAKVIEHVLGDYAEKPSDELYMKTRFGTASSDKPRPDLLRLQGARWAWMSEPQGNQFNEELLKAHTGDDPITARDLYGKAASYTTFRPSHTIVFLTNNPPRTDDVGPSMQRRVRIIKFLEDFRGAREDRGLETALKRETVGILAFLTQAAKAWWEDGGLPEPQQVTDWSTEYIEDNDPLAQFIAEVCTVGRGVSASGSALWGSYQDWAAKHEIETGTMMGFGMSLGRRFENVHTRTGKVYKGIRPLSAMELAERADG